MTGSVQKFGALLTAGLFLLLGGNPAPANPSWTYRSKVETRGQPVPNLPLQDLYGFIYGMSISGLESQGVWLRGLDQQNATGPATIHAFDVQAFFVDTYGPDHYRFGHSWSFGYPNFELIMELTDSASGAVGEFHFDGRMDGAVGPNALALALSLDSPTQQSQVLGDSRYTVTLGRFVDPTAIQGYTDHPFEPLGSGFLEARVDVAAVLASAPEPATWALLCIGTAVLIATRRGPIRSLTSRRRPAP